MKTGLKISTRILTKNISSALRGRLFNKSIQNLSTKDHKVTNPFFNLTQKNVLTFFNKNTNKTTPNLSIKDHKATNPFSNLTQKNVLTFFNKNTKNKINKFSYTTETSKQINNTTNTMQELERNTRIITPPLLGVGGMFGLINFYLKNVAREDVIIKIRSKESKVVLNFENFEKIDKKPKGELSGWLIRNKISGKTYVAKGAQSFKKMLLEYMIAEVCERTIDGPSTIFIQKETTNKTEVRLYTASEIRSNSMDLEDFSRKLRNAGKLIEKHKNNPEISDKKEAREYNHAKAFVASFKKTGFTGAGKIAAFNKLFNNRDAKFANTLVTMDVDKNGIPTTFNLSLIDFERHSSKNPSFITKEDTTEDLLQLCFVEYTWKASSLNQPKYVSETLHPYLVEAIERDRKKTIDPESGKKSNSIDEFYTDMANIPYDKLLDKAYALNGLLIPICNQDTDEV